MVDCRAQILARHPYLWAQFSIRVLKTKKQLLNWSLLSPPTFLSTDGLISLLTSDPTYQELLSDYLHPKGADLETSAYHTANGKDSNHNGSMQNGNVMMNGDKKTDWGWHWPCSWWCMLHKSAQYYYTFPLCNRNTFWLDISNQNAL